MAKFRIRLKVQGLELEVDGEREDIPVIARAVQQQFAGMLEPITVAAEVPRIPARSENADGDGASGKRSARRRSRSSAEGETTPIEYRHNAAKFGNPLQTWTVTDKCIWMLYALKHGTGHKEVSASQLVGVYNEHFKNAGKLHPPNVTRELAKAKVQNPSAVGEDKGLWLLTDHGERVATELIKSIQNPTLV